jgi:phosphohistidine phosphatase
MELYLIRHGIAAERGTYANDDERPLTAQGRKRMCQVAKRLRGLGLTLDPILSSPLTRAQQTAEVLLDAGFGPTLEIVDFLAPEGSMDDWLNWLANQQQVPGSNLALVGHEPDLGSWAEQLVWGSTRGSLNLKKGGVIGLRLPDGGSPIGNSSLFWLAPPRFLLP